MFFSVCSFVEMKKRTFFHKVLCAIKSSVEKTEEIDFNLETKKAVMMSVTSLFLPVASFPANRTFILCSFPIYTKTFSIFFRRFKLIEYVFQCG